MKLTVPRAALHVALTQAARIVERRTTIPILANVRIETEGERLLRLTATDLDLEVRLRLEATIEEPGATTVPTHTFAALVAKYDGDTVAIATKGEDATLTLSCSRSRATLQRLPVEDHPALDEGAATHRFALPAASLVEALDAVAFAISTEETRYYLNGVHLTAAETIDGTARLGLVATDGHRLARWRGPLPEGASGMPSVIVPRKTVGEIRKIAAEGAKGGHDQVAIALDESKIRFEIGETILVSKLIDGTYPDYGRVIPAAFETEARVDRAELVAALDRVTTVASERGRAVKCGFFGDEMRLEVANPDVGFATETLRIETSDATSLEIGFNGAYLKAVADALGGDTIAVRLPDNPGAPTVFVPVPETRDGADLLVVLMPMRV